VLFGGCVIPAGAGDVWHLREFVANILFLGGGFQGQGPAQWGPAQWLYKRGTWNVRQLRSIAIVRLNAIDDSLKKEKVGIVGTIGGI